MGAPLTALSPVPSAGRRCILAVVIVAALLRCWSTASIPLIITNDGVWYLKTGESYFKGEPVEIPPVRTPGYPLFLAGVYHVFGFGPVAVLIVQHAMGIGIAVLVAFCVGRFAGPIPALIAGLFCALDPWLLAHETYALTETLSIFLFMAAVCIVLCWRRPEIQVAVLLGLSLGLATLVRPAFQITIPFLLLAWLLMVRVDAKRFVLLSCVAAIGLAAPLAPWLNYNFKRGVYGIANGFSGVQWVGLFHLGLLDWNYPLNDPELERLLAPYRESGSPGLDVLPGTVRDIDGWGSRAGLLADWNKASIRANFEPYLRACGYALCWQLNMFPKAGGISHDELTWYVWRAAQDGDNGQFGGVPHEQVGLAAFYMYGSGGPMRGLLRLWHKNRTPGIPQAPLFVIMLLVMLVNLVRRQWGFALVWLASLAFFASHVAMLIPVGRYTMPMWPLWFMAVGMALGWLPFRRGGAGAESQKAEPGAWQESPAGTLVATEPAR